MDRPVVVSKANKALAVPRTPGIMGLFPEGKPLKDLWVIQHGLAEYLLLRQLGFRVPNPITCYYDWCRGTPFDVQKITCSMLTASPRAYVLNAMGTGKTRAALWAWDYLRGNGYAGKLLIVAPLSTLSNVWGHEVFAVLPHRKVQILHGTKKKRLERLADPEAEIFVINNDGLRVIENDIRNRPDIDVMIIDELSKYRNNNDRSKAMAKFATRFKFLWGMTGSPMPNEPTDVWMQCKIVTPHSVPRYKTHARDMLMTKISDYVWVPKHDATDRAYSWMQPAVRFTLDDVVELPDTVRRVVDVPLSAQQNTVYSTLAHQMAVQVGTGEINAVNAAVKMNKLLQVAGGYVYTSAKQTIVLDSDPRKEALIDLIDAATGKVLVFFPFRHIVDGVSAALRAHPSQIDHALVHGGVLPSQRNLIFDAFQRTGQYKALLAHPACMAHGLTLTAANTIIWYLPMPDYDIYDQANARIRRVGQKQRQQVLHLQATPVERRIYAMLGRKEKVQNQLLALFADATTQAQQGA
jgi:SNF2 family DNA or RNA helicase